VQQHVRVRVALESALERDLDAADDQLAPRDERVYVEALADSHGVRNVSLPEL
jgi:hypothetical protein